MKKTLLIFLSLCMTACISSQPILQKTITKRISQCVFKPMNTESEKAQFSEQYRNFTKAIYQIGHRLKIQAVKWLKLILIFRQLGKLTILK